MGRRFPVLYTGTHLGKAADHLNVKVAGLRNDLQKFAEIFHHLEERRSERTQSRERESEGEGEGETDRE